MPVECPKCGSRYLKPSHPRSRKEKKLWMSFRQMIRCRDCKNRFITPLIIWEDLKYARCPRCERFDLNGWTGKSYEPEFFWTGFKVMFGGHRYRCEYCRLNFASFRARREAFTFKRWRKKALETVGPDGVAEVSPELMDTVQQHPHAQGEG